MTMLMKSLAGSKIALLAANGFFEPDMTAAQRVLIESGAQAKIISPDQGLVNGWTGTGWGHHYPVDAVLSTALGADYDMLIVPGGARSLDKLTQTAHTKRFISSFLAGEKPVALMDDAVKILAFTGHVRGLNVGGPAALKAEMTEAGAIWSLESPCIHGNLMTGAIDEAGRVGFTIEMATFFATYAPVKQAA